MSYGGAFDSLYRNKLTDIWVPKVSEFNIPLSNDVGLINVVGKKVVIESWKGLYNLSDDSLSIENAIVLE
jgi:hypothetical protein